MSTRQAKQSRRHTRKLKAEIKIDALTEFMDFAIKQPLWRRVRFAYRVVFKRL